MPILRQTSDALPPLQTVRPVQQGKDGDDWFVDVHKQPADEPDSAAFQLGMVRKLARRVQQEIVRAPAVAVAAHGGLDSLRAQDALAGRSVGPASGQEHHLPKCPPCQQPQRAGRARDHPQGGS
ncbi:MAG: hypothetical protein IPK26_29420 [Planctomycetes bacterium]|nr:hypothetical protein [Planctomycetota bacterium]